MTKLSITYHVSEPRWKTRLKPYCKTIKTVLEATLAQTKLANIQCEFEIAVVLADDAFVKNLNHQYRGKNKPTNVLSFPSMEHIEKNIKTLAKGAGEFPLGDIVLAFETVEKEAKSQQKTFRDHAAHLLAHGLLHLIGYDHEVEKEAASMEQKEVKILKTLGVKNPYL